MTATYRPVDETARLEALDVLRGFAVLGILVINVQLFAMPYAASVNPTALGPPSSIDFAIWTVSHVLADQKFMSIFAMLFGAGVLLFTTRAADRGARSAALHYRRMFWLLVFGLMHAYLLWYGDILVLYAVCGMLLYPLRRLGARTLIVVGAVLVGFESIATLVAGASLGAGSPEVVADYREAWSPDPATLASELEAFRGSWLVQLPLRAAYSLEYHAFELWTTDLWRAGGLMLIGMALLKVGVLSGERSRAFYARLALAGLVVGFALTGWGVVRGIAEQWRFEYSYFVGAQWNYWGSVVAAFGWIGLVLAVWKSGALRGAVARLACAGRMAFTCYIVETLICTTLFYGHGFGYFGSIGRLGQVAVTLAVWALLLLLAPWWLARFRFGPLEWVWRTLTYGRVEPLAREGGPSPGAVRED
jgi:uncharacterized protein